MTQGSIKLPRRVIETDVLIIGSGAGGAVSFYEMSHDRETLLIEEGENSSGDLIFESGFLSISKAYRKSGLYPTFSTQNLTLGEGMAVGGSTEVNGGLFWETPNLVISKWKKILGEDFEVNAFQDNFEYFKSLLHVKDEIVLNNYDNDSMLLALGATHLGWKVSNAKRATTNCVRKNLCVSGCKSGAKNSMSVTLIPMGIALGGRLIKGLRAKKIYYGEIIKVIAVKNNQNYEIRCKELILSCGAIESPKLLMKSGLIKKRKISVGIHINLKTLAIFGKEINANSGTIFVKQVQEFIADGVLIMPTNYNELYLALSSYGFDDSIFSKVIDNISKSSLTTLQVDIASKLIYMPFFNKIIGPFFKLSDLDHMLVKDYLKKVVQLLFSVGAIEILLPVRDAKFLKSYTEATTFIDLLEKRDLLMSSVHFMSSLPLNSINIDNRGRLKQYNRISVLDASVLPTNTVESPQGSIMALVRYLLLKRK